MLWVPRKVPQGKGWLLFHKPLAITWLTATPVQHEAHALLLSDCECFTIKDLFF